MDSWGELFILSVYIAVGLWTSPWTLQEPSSLADCFSPRWNLSDASAPGESHWPRADGWSRHLAMVYRTVWGNYCCPGVSLHLGRSIYNVEISKRISSCWPSASTPLMTAQCGPHYVRKGPKFLAMLLAFFSSQKFPSLPDLLRDSKFHAQFNSLFVSQSIDISRLCPGGGGVSYFIL